MAKTLTRHFLFLGLVTMAGVALLLSQPASLQNQFFLSFSLPQILFGLSWLLVACLCFYCARWISRPENDLPVKIRAWLENPTISRMIMLGAAEMMLLSLAALIFGSNDFFGRMSGYLIRLRPFIGWMVLVSLQVIVLEVQINQEFRAVKPTHIKKTQLILFIISLALFCLLWILITFTGFGVGTNDDPIRTPTIYITYQEFLIALLVTCQVWVAIQIGKHVFDAEQQHNIKIVGPLLLGLVIWSAAVLIWIDEPMRSSYYRIGPFPPNGDYIPAADPTRFDLPGQLALIGEGLNAGNYIDNPFYVFMVMVFRIAGGQFYDRMITFQIAVLAFIPVCLFIIGRMFSGQYLGLLLAIVSIIREKNIIRYSADTWMSPVKALLTEPFITLLLVLFCLFLIKWLRDEGSSPGNLVLAGGIFGLSTLVRTNPWFLLPVSVGVIFLKMGFKLRKTIYFSVIFGSAVLASILPWMIRSQATIDTPFYFLFKMQHSVVEERYQKTSPKENKLVPPTQLQISPEVRNLYAGSETYLSVDKIHPGIPNAGIDLVEYRPAGITGPAATFDEGLQNQNSIPPGKPADKNQQEKSLVGIIGEHFVFNLVNTVQILPTLLPNSTPGTPVIFPTSVFTEGKAAGLWQMFAGNLSLLFILVCLSIGIGFNYRMPFLAGIFPLIFFFTYSAGTAVALTSASRYTQPIEWVVYLYFSAGLLCLGQIIAKPFLEVLSDTGPLQAGQEYERQAPVEKKSFPLKSYAPILVSFLVIGSLIPLSDLIFSKKYTIQPKEEMITQLDVQRLAESSAVTAEEYQAYLNRPETEIKEGRLVYAQYYRAGEGEDMSRMRSVIYDYPRITFELLGPYKPTLNVLLPLEEPWPDEYLNGQTAIVIGCASGGGLDAISILLPDLDFYLSRTGAIPQECR